MFVKIATITLIAFVARSASLQNQEGERVWNGFTASWSRNTSTHSYGLPQTLKAAEDQGWTCISGVDPPEAVTPMCYNDDPTFVLLFKKGRAIGFQLAFLVSDVRNSAIPLKYNELDALIMKTINGKLYYTATAYFYNNESKGIRRIWFQEKNGLLEIPTNATLVPSKTRYYLRSCVPTMGTHYYTWKFDSDCATLYPWFLLATEDNIIGVGLQVFGRATTLGSRKWWDIIPDGSVYAVMSDPPPCAVHAIEEYGVISMHVWFLDKPKDVTCNRWHH